jgi:hypothetical protein
VESIHAPDLRIRFFFKCALKICSQFRGLSLEMYICPEANVCYWLSPDSSNQFSHNRCRWKGLCLDLFLRIISTGFRYISFKKMPKYLKIWFFLWIIFLYFFSGGDFYYSNPFDRETTWEHTSCVLSQVAHCAIREYDFQRPSQTRVNDLKKVAIKTIAFCRETNYYFFLPAMKLDVSIQKK